jgi:hypothetical protein
MIVKAEAVYAKSEDQTLTPKTTSGSTTARRPGRGIGKKETEDHPKKNRKTQAEEKREDDIRNEIGKENNRKKYRTKSRRRTGRARLWSCRKVFPMISALAAEG